MAPLWIALLLAALPLQALAAPLGVEACRGLRQQRDALASQAMQAEIALVLATRRRLCPLQEALAEQANANSGAAAGTADPAGIVTAGGAGTGGPQALAGNIGAWPVESAQAVHGATPKASTTQATAPKTVPLDAVPLATGSLQPAALELDYTAYLQCRRQAEQQLRRSRVILYTNQSGFSFYTLNGASLAREADAWQQRLSASCGAAGGG